jgi:hypothetical protein
MFNGMRYDYSWNRRGSSPMVKVFAGLKDVDGQDTEAGAGGHRFYETVRRRESYGARCRAP